MAMFLIPTPRERIRAYLRTQFVTDLCAGSIVLLAVAVFIVTSCTGSHP